MFSWDKIQDMHIWQNYHRRDAMFSLHPIRWYIILIHLTTNDVHFNPLIKVVSAKLSAVQSLFYFPLCNLYVFCSEGTTLMLL